MLNSLIGLFYYNRSFVIVIIIIIHLSIAPLHDLRPSQRCITIEPAEYVHTAYCVMTIIVNQGTKKQNKKEQRINRISMYKECKNKWLWTLVQLSADISALNYSYTTVKCRYIGLGACPQSVNYDGVCIYPIAKNNFFLNAHWISLSIEVQVNV